jgi:ABC-2 type transport system ATP-binding protein
VELAERFGAALDRPLRDLSKGNRQKVALIQAFMQRPALVVLDEPTSGLDPLVQEAFRSLVRETAAAGATVFLSSHSLDEVQHVADRVGIIRGGRLVAVDVMEAMLERSVRHVSVRFAEPIDTSKFAEIPGVQVVDGDGPSLRLRVEGSMETLVKTLGDERVIDLTSAPADLEEIFLGYYQEQGE